MRFRVSAKGDGAKKLSEAMRARAANHQPATAKIGEWIAREARRRAPRGDSRRGASLQSSMGHVEPKHNVTVLTSDRPYARVQAEGTSYLPGGAILPGGPLKAKLLAMPVSDEGKQLLASLPSGVSLRSQKLTLIRTKNGKLFLIRTEYQRKPRGSKKRVGPSFAGLVTRILFRLIPAARMRPNPPPQGYAPRFSEPGLRAFAAAVLRRWITTGRP